MRCLSLCQAVAVITLVDDFILVPPVLILRPIWVNVGIVFSMLHLANVTLAVTSIVGLWRCRWWGFAAFYFFGVASMVLAGNLLIAFVVVYSLEAAIALNGVALLAVAFLQGRCAKSV